MAELLDQEKAYIIVAIYKEGDKNDCSNYWRISLLSTSYKIVFNILFSRVRTHTEEIIGDHNCGF
jgi:hypothetical protein